MTHSLFASAAGKMFFRWRSYLPYVLLLPLLFLALPQSGWVEADLGEAVEIGWDLLSASVAFAGVAVRLAAAGTRPMQWRDGEMPAPEGAYAVVRHPGYLGNLLILLGLTLSTHVWWLV